jgi:hypothetical protein
MKINVILERKSLYGKRAPCLVFEFGSLVLFIISLYWRGTLRGNIRGDQSRDSQSSQMDTKRFSADGRKERGGSDWVKKKPVFIKGGGE